ncbi:hypothetical protein VNO78_30482 [Psophocarpus tetragonolobus]|uniref:Glutathione S-transferase n=1 Tax=Psophocarpus tetragonolobus TaxID=3891 RepID=A0AAN9X5C3_PSOTE
MMRHINQIQLNSRVLEIQQNHERSEADCYTSKLPLCQRNSREEVFWWREVGYLDIAAGWMCHWLSVLEELGEMKLLNAERFPSLHEWSHNFIQTAPVKDCIPPRESVIEYFSFGINYVRSLASNKS